MDQAPPAALAVNASQKEENSSDGLARQLGLPQEKPKQSGWDVREQNCAPAIILTLLHIGPKV